MYQLSRVVEHRGGLKKPQLSDFRGNGAIEQSSDIVMDLYRPEYYGFDEDENGNPTKNLLEVLVLKNKDGEVGTIQLDCILQNQMILDHGAAENIKRGQPNVK